MIDNVKKIAIGCDHAGYKLKEEIKGFLIQNGFEIQDFGTYSEESVDYPDFAHPVAESVENGFNNKGILICGSGIGVCITANKHANIRAALCWNAEIAAISRKHNDANIVCLPARFTDSVLAINIVKTFLSTEFEGGRHNRRIKKIPLSK